MATVIVDTRDRPFHESLIEQVHTRGCMVEFCARQNAPLLERKDVPWSLERLVLTYGVGRYCTANMWYGIHRGKMKDCYKNATRLTQTDPDRFIYMEGYGLREELGIVVGEHAWVLDKALNYAVVDPTWRRTKGAAYIGIPFRYDYLSSHISEFRLYGLLDTPWSGWRVKQRPVSEWLHPDANKLPHDFTVPADMPDPTIGLQQLQERNNG